MCNHHHNKDTELLHHSLIPAITLTSLTITNLFASSIILSFWDYYTNKVIQWVTLWDWLFSLSVEIDPRCCLCWQCSFLLLSRTTECGYNSLFNHPPKGMFVVVKVSFKVLMIAYSIWFSTLTKTVGITNIHVCFNGLGRCMLPYIKLPCWMWLRMWWSVCFRFSIVSVIILNSLNSLTHWFKPKTIEPPRNSICFAVSTDKICLYLWWWVEK